MNRKISKNYFENFYKILLFVAVKMLTKTKLFLIKRKKTSLEIPQIFYLPSEQSVCFFG